jgi:hypothetical protein
MPAMTGKQRIGCLEIEAVCEPAADSGPECGDVWDVLETRHGTRMLVVDAVGRGSRAAGLARRIAATWRSLAPDEPSTRQIALHLDLLVAGAGDPEQFATAMFLTFGATGPAEVLCCGHPPPLLIRGPVPTGSVPTGSVPTGPAPTGLGPGPTPPLGLLDLTADLAADLAEPGEIGLDRDDRLLLVTDGVTEARDPAGRFYPVAERAALLSSEPRFAAAMAADLHDYTVGRPMDDTLLVLVRRITSDDGASRELPPVDRVILVGGTGDRDERDRLTVGRAGERHRLNAGPPDRGGVERGQRRAGVVAVDTAEHHRTVGDRPDRRLVRSGLEPERHRQGDPQRVAGLPPPPDLDPAAASSAGRPGRHPDAQRRRRRAGNDRDLDHRIVREPGGLP